MTTLSAALAMALLSTGLIWLVIEDLRRFEIAPTAAILTAGGLLGLLIATGTNPVPPLLVACAAGLLAIAIRRVNRAALGQGDIILFALIGMASGPQFATETAIAFGGASLLIATAFLVARNKPIRLSSYRRHACPAAPAGSIAILLGLTLNLA